MSTTATNLKRNMLLTTVMSTLVNSLESDTENLLGVSLDEKLMSITKHLVVMIPQEKINELLSVKQMTRMAPQPMPPQSMSPNGVPANFLPPAHAVDRGVVNVQPAIGDK